MTTAHRPTWAPTKGGEEQGGNRLFVPSRAFSAKDQPAHTKLKFRSDGQSSERDLKKRNLREELEEKERNHFEDEKRKDLKLLTDTGESTQRSVLKLAPKAVDADDEEDGDEDDESDEDEEDSEDEEAELLAELERIRKERAEEMRKKAEEDAEKDLKEKEEQLLRGNPLINQIDRAPNFAVTRRWDDDVVFKNQARGEPKAQKRFINDTVRSDFHQKFLQRYIR